VVLGDLVVDAARHEVRKRGELIHLTPREFELLVTLSAHPGLVFTRSQLLNRIWGDEYYAERLIDVHMAGLRKKVEDDPADPQYIETVRGVGFRFGARNRSSNSPSSHTSHPAHPAHPAHSASTSSSSARSSSTEPATVERGDIGAGPGSES
jgi:DNA-binding winged helix-turn-helix (wHTH) protein